MADERQPVEIHSRGELAVVRDRVDDGADVIGAIDEGVIAPRVWIGKGCAARRWRVAPPRFAARRVRPNHRSLANAASNATSDAAKSKARIRAHASRAPNSRSIPASSHSTDRGPW